MVKFSRPLFLNLTSITLSHYQLRVLSLWVALITVLAEYIDRSGSRISISEADRRYIKNYLAPPLHWTIVAASLEADMWKFTYRHTPKMIFDYNSAEEFRHRSLAANFVPNTQISSFGMGNVFIQVFSSPNMKLVGDFRIAAKSRGLIPIWPLPSSFWPFTEGSAKFPSKLVLNDEVAEIISQSFSERIDALLGRL